MKKIRNECTPVGFLYVLYYRLKHNKGLSSLHLNMLEFYDSIYGVDLSSNEFGQWYAYEYNKDVANIALRMMTDECKLKLASDVIKLINKLT